jgi:hypothetical protein
MSQYDDGYNNGARFPNQILNRTDSSKCTLTLKQIQKELKLLTDQAHQGIDIDEARFDYLLRAQEHNEEYKAFIAEERASWRDSVYEFAEQCLERTRSFVPVNIFESSLDNLTALGLSSELAKRVLQRQCLWLTRMSKAEIASLHESDLVGRFNSSAQNMDIIETAAIYIALPETFNGDEVGRKAQWRDAVENSLRRMLQDNDNGELPDGRIRHPAYEGLQFGPIEDVTSVRETNIVSGKNSHKPRRSFLEVCKKHSILSSANLKADPVLDSSDSEAGGFQDEYEDDGQGDEEEEEVYVLEGSSEKLSAGITFQPATGYQTRDFVEVSDEEEQDEPDEEGEEPDVDEGGDLDDAGAEAEEGYDEGEGPDDAEDVAEEAEAEQGGYEDDSSSESEGREDGRVFDESLAEEQAHDHAEYCMVDGPEEDQETEPTDGEEHHQREFVQHGTEAALDSGSESSSEDGGEGAVADDGGGEEDEVDQLAEN